MHAGLVGLGFFNEIILICKIVQCINWKKFHYLEGLEIEITSFVNALLFSCMQISPCDVLGKEFAN